MQGPDRKKAPKWLRTLLLILLGYLFLSSINMMGAGFKLMGGSFSSRLLVLTRNPVAGLMVGIITTSIVQSSTLVSSLIVALVAAGSLDFRLAVPVIMGANIGTTITATLVAMGYVGRRGRFRRAFAAATMHDFFNIITCCILFPLQVTTHFLSDAAEWLARSFTNLTHITSARNPLTICLSLLANATQTLLLDVFRVSAFLAAVIMAVLALVVLFVSLYFLTRTMRSLMAGTVETALDRYIFGRPLVAMAVGIVITFLIHSSSVTTSLMVPLVTAGILTLEQVFPYTLGANIGTTLTALCAAIGTGRTDAVAIALTHTLFNCIGVSLIFPIRRIRNIPVFLAKALAALTLRSRWYALVYIVITFFAIPGFFLFGVKYVRIALSWVWG